MPSKLRLHHEDEMRVMMVTVEIRAPRYVKRENMEELLRREVTPILPALNERCHVLSVKARESGG